MAAILEPPSWICLFQMFAILCFANTELVNIAVDKPTNMSSMIDNLGSSLAVDGNTTYVVCSESSVTDTSDIWWWLDLTQVVVVRHIRLYYRLDLAFGINGSKIYVSEVPDIPLGDLEPCYTVTIGDENDVPDAIYISCDIRGRYIIILKDGNYDNMTDSVLALCEVQVYVCSNGTYGLNCSVPCGQCRMGDCDPVSGVCQGGCRVGYAGDQCHNECESGKYGQNCAMTCGQCGGSGCDHVTGWCRGGCRDGYTGNTCNITLSVPIATDETMSPVIAGIIGGVIMLVAIILIVVVVIAIICYVAKVPKHTRAAHPIAGRSAVRYSRSKDNHAPPSRDPVPAEELDDRDHQYEQLESPRYVATTPASAMHATVIRPSIIITPDGGDPQSYEAIDDTTAKQRDDPSQSIYMPMGRTESQSAYEPMEIGLDARSIELVDHPELDHSLGAVSYVSMRNFRPYENNDTYM